MWDGKWVANNSNCSDAEQLFNSIVLRFKDVIKSVRYEYWNVEPKRSNFRELLRFREVIKSVQYQYWNEEPKGYNFSKTNLHTDWHLNDNKKYGRCYTLTPSIEHTKYGIRMIELQLLANSSIITHTNGNLQKGVHHPHLQLGKLYEFFYDWHSYELLDFGGDVCNTDKEYSKDVCINAAIEKELLNKVGCTNPFGPNKTEICTGQDEAMKTIAIISDANENAKVDCYHPCSFSTITLSEKMEWNVLKHFNFTNTKVRLNFPEIIKVTESYYTYSLLSLIAEIGGCVGLFLGVSINMVTNLLEYLVAKFDKFQRGFEV